MFAFLSDSNIPCVAFETGRTPEYQALLDANPLFKQLQSEWRDFFRAQRNICVDFIEASSINYAASDFFDAVHYIGQTEHRVAARLVESLTRLETTCKRTD